MLFLQARFQEMVENEKLTQARVHAFAGKIALTPIFHHAKFLLHAELPVLFLKHYNLSQMQGKFQDWFVGKKKDPSLHLTKIIWSLSDFIAQYKACSPSDLPAVKKAWIQATNKQTKKMNLGLMNRQLLILYLMFVYNRWVHWESNRQQIPRQFSYFKDSFIFHLRDEFFLPLSSALSFSVICMIICYIYYELLFILVQPAKQFPK